MTPAQIKQVVDGPAPEMTLVTVAVGQRDVEVMIRVLKDTGSRRIWPVARQIVRGYLVRAGRGNTEGTEVTGLTRMTDAARHAEGGAK